MNGFLERYAAVAAWLLLLATTIFFLLVTSILNFHPESPVPQREILLRQLLDVVRQHGTALNIINSSILALATLAGATWSIIKGIRYARSRLPLRFMEVMEGDYDATTANRKSMRGLIDNIRTDMQFNSVTLHMGPLHDGLKQVGYGSVDGALRSFERAQVVGKQQQDLAKKRFVAIRDQRATAHVMSGVIFLQKAVGSKVEQERAEVALAAMREFNNAIALDANDLDALELKAECQRRYGRIDQAFETYQRIVALTENENEALRKRYDLALIFARSKRYQAEIKKSEAEQRSQRGLVGVDPRYQEARELLDDAIRRLELLVRSDEHKLELARCAIENAWVAHHRPMQQPLIRDGHKNLAHDELRNIVGSAADTLRIRLREL